MIASVLRLLGLRRARRRVSTHLTPKYEAARVARLARCAAQFKAGKVGTKYEPILPSIKESRNV